MQWLVVGTGAVGSLMAVNLKRIGEHVHIKPRQPELKQIELIANAHSHTFITQQLPLQAPTQVFAAVKAYQVKALLAELEQHWLPQHSTLILSYNGMLDDEAQILPQRSLHWVTTHGAYKKEQEVVHAGQGESWLGWAQVEMASSHRPAEIFSALNNALPVLHWSPAISQRRWQKLAINCLINPFTVIYDCRNGELIAKDIERDQYAIAKEICWLAEHRGIHLQADHLVQQAQQVIKNTAHNFSSMLMDVRQQQQTEIDYLNGFVARQLAAEGRTAPANENLWRRVDQLSRSSSIKSTTSRPKPDSAE